MGKWELSGWFWITDKKRSHCQIPPVPSPWAIPLPSTAQFYNWGKKDACSCICISAVKYKWCWSNTKKNNQEIHHFSQVWLELFSLWTSINELHLIEKHEHCAVQPECVFLLMWWNTTWVGCWIWNCENIISTAQFECSNNYKVFVVKHTSHNCLPELFRLSDFFPFC